MTEEEAKAIVDKIRAAEKFEPQHAVLLSGVLVAGNGQSHDAFCVIEKGDDGQLLAVNLYGRSVNAVVSLSAMDWAAIMALVSQT